MVDHAPYVSLPTLRSLPARSPFAATLGAVLAVVGLLVPGMAVAQEKADTSSYPEWGAAGFVQNQVVVEHRDETSSSFAVKRARFGFTGHLREDISVNLIGGGFEPPNGTPRFVNAFVDVDIHPLARIRAGQFLVPFGLEGPDGVVSNPAIERSVAGRRLNDFTLFRDIGVQISGEQSSLSYAVALLNGAGANTAETIDPKDVLGRVGAKLGPVEVGVSGHYGQRASVGSGFNDRLRFGVDARYRGDPVFLRAEYVGLRQEQSSNADQVGRGGYVLGGYRFTERWEVIGRFDMHDPSSSVNDDLFLGVTIGPNYKIVGPSEVAINYEIRDDETTSGIQHRLLVQLQVVL